MADKYIYDNAGQRQEKAAIQTSAGAGDAGKIPALDSTGRFDSSMMPVGVEIETESIVCSENLAAGAIINVFNSSGALKVRNADATAVGKEGNGFVLSAYTTGQTATVYRKGFNTAVTGLTIGTLYYLAASPGAITATAPSATGNIVQTIGRADATTSVYFVERDTLVKA